MDKVKNLANSIFEAACEALDIHSPSGKFEWIAEMSTEGQVQGTKKSTPKVVDAIKTQQEAIAKTAENGNIESNFDAVKGFTSRVAKVIVPVQLDGREIARGTAEFISEQLVWEAL